MKGCRKKWIHDFPSLKSIHDSRAANAELILQDRTKQSKTCEVCIYTSALGTATLLGELCRKLYNTCSRPKLCCREPRKDNMPAHKKDAFQHSSFGRPLGFDDLQHCFVEQAVF